LSEFLTFCLIMGKYIKLIISGFLFLFFSAFSQQIENLNGMVSMNCSGVVVRLGRTNEQKAIILTNGHCIKFMNPGSFKVDGNYNRPIKIFGSNGHITFNKAKVIYATMTKSDFAILRLKVTYKELLDKGIQIFEISKLRPQMDEKVLAISGYWKESQTCFVDYVVHKLKEQNYTFHNAIALKKPCRIKGGWSGSPIISVESGEIIGIINTYNNGPSKCNYNNPCEINENGVKRAVRLKTYAQQISLVWGCLNKLNSFDLTQQSCELPH
jgi:V8-like Glu-specific endopeptidase